jgi:hypothetical protein
VRFIAHPEEQMIVKNCVSYRRAASILLALLALGITAPIAGAKPIDSGATPSYAFTSPIQPGASNMPASVMHSSHSAISSWGYLAIGIGAAAVAVVSVGGMQAAGRRRRQRRTAQHPMAS